MRYLFFTVVAFMMAGASISANQSIPREDVCYQSSAVGVSYEHGQILLSASSKVVVYNAFGSVIYHNDQVRTVDCASWQHGRYVAVINDTETFKFSI